MSLVQVSQLEVYFGQTVHDIGAGRRHHMRFIEELHRHFLLVSVHQRLRFLQQLEEQL